MSFYPSITHAHNNFNDSNTQFTSHCNSMPGFFQKALIYVLSLSIGTLSVGIGLGFYGASFTTVVDGLDLDTNMKRSVFNALAPLFAVAGAPLVNFATERYGRRYPAMVSSFVVIVGWVLVVVTQKQYSALAYVGRAISGLGLGAVSTINPVYIAELSPTEVRGAYGVMSQLFCSIGSLVVYLLGVWLNWRTIAGISIAFPLITVIALFFVPESPAFDRILAKEKLNQKKSLCHKKFIKPILISMLVVIFQQFSGVNALMSNLTAIFELSNISVKSTVASVIVISGKVLVTAISTPFAECIGRRGTWMISSIGQAVFLLISWANQKWNWSDVLPIIMLVGDTICFGIGLGTIPWFIIPELFPDDVRTVSMGLVQAINWGLAALNVFVFPTMQETMTLAWVFFFYGAIMVVSFLYGLFLLPETRFKEMGANIKENKKNSSEKEESFTTSQVDSSYSFHHSTDSTSEETTKSTYL